MPHYTTSATMQYMIYRTCCHYFQWKIHPEMESQTPVLVRAERGKAGHCLRLDLNIQNQWEKISLSSLYRHTGNEKSTGDSANLHQKLTCIKFFYCMYSTNAGYWQLTKTSYSSDVPILKKPDTDGQVHVQVYLKGKYLWEFPSKWRENWKDDWHWYCYDSMV